VRTPIAGRNAQSWNTKLMPFAHGLAQALFQVGGNFGSALASKSMLSARQHNERRSQRTMR
jgi:hypothetical protein